MMEFRRSLTGLAAIVISAAASLTTSGCVTNETNNYTYNNCCPTAAVTSPAPEPETVTVVEKEKSTPLPREQQKPYIPPVSRPVNNHKETTYPQPNPHRYPNPAPQPKPNQIPQANRSLTIEHRVYQVQPPQPPQPPIIVIEKCHPAPVYIPPPVYRPIPPPPIPFFVNPCPPVISPLYRPAPGPVFRPMETPHRFYYNRQPLPCPPNTFNRGVNFHLQYRHIRR